MLSFVVCLLLVLFPALEELIGGHAEGQGRVVGAEVLRVALEALLNEVIRCAGEPRFGELPGVAADKLVLCVVPALEKGDHACA